MAATASVLIPTFDRAAMLRTAVESALRQSYRDLEVLIGVDRGTADVVRVARSFRDDRVRTFIWRKNRGPYPVYESLLKESRGAYIHMFSDDDVLEPAFLERCIRALESSEARCVWTDDYPWDGEKIIPDPRAGRKMPFLYPNINATVFRRQTLEQVSRTFGGVFRTDIRAHGDAILFYRLNTLFGPEAFAHVAEPLVWNRMHEKQLSRNPHLWSVVEDVIANRAMGQPMGYRKEILTFLWVLKKQAEAVTGKRLPRILH